MSTMSEEARKASKSKAERLIRSDPTARVDASGYRPDGALNGDVAAGLRPVSRRAYRRGGKIDGHAGPSRADRKPRASGGALTANSLINRNVKDANEERGGITHRGGLKTGGRAHKDMGGLALPQWSAPVARKEGGKVHSDAAQDRKLIHEEMHKSGCGCDKCAGGRVGRKSGGRNWIAGAIKHPGSLHKSLHVPAGEKIPAKKLAKAEHSDNPKLAKKAHLAETLKGLHKRDGGTVGGIPDGTRPVAGRLARKGGGRTKGKTNVNIIITQPGGMARPPMAPPVAAAPPAGPIGLRQGVPPPAPAAAGAPPPAIPMARATGGRAGFTGKLVKPGKYPIETGSGGGLGRLEKAERAKRVNP